jgi:hypothetical protein
MEQPVSRSRVTARSRGRQDRFFDPFGSSFDFAIALQPDGSLDSTFRRW